jgi:putative PEP-CTERM system integral membrane protein
MMKKYPKFLRKLTSPQAWAYTLFWSWNLIFLAFMLFGFAPRMLPEMMTAVRTGDLPAAFPIYALILTLVPVLAVILGLTLLRRSPGRLFILGYGIEGPLMLLLGVRFFVIGELTPAVALLIAIAGLGLAAFSWQLFDQKIDSRGVFLTLLRATGLTLLLMTGLYAGVWIAFYALPLFAVGWHLLVDILSRLPQFLSDLREAIYELATVQWRWIPFWTLGFILLIYTATLFVLMPLAVPILCVRAWWRGVRALAANVGRLGAVALPAAVLAACIVLLIQANRQPQHRAFALLKNPPASPAQAEVLRAEEDGLRVGLLNAYLASQRYVSAVGEVYHVSEMYQELLDLSPTQADRIQQLYETVARPVLYLPVNPPKPDRTRWDNRAQREEAIEAAELYAAYFDEAIIDAEREAIIAAVRSTWSIDRAQAAWQVVDDREVHLMRQELKVTEHGDWAEFELYEVYQNQTTQRQEVVYYFSLPESAVVTGVWLGNSPDRADRFTYRVSPRGAAQAIYRNELQRNLDPALVEQIGPRQYRLRIFPIEPQRWHRDETSSQPLIEAGPPLYMWLTWRVLARDNTWPLPRLAEKRNLYWDDSSVRLLNDQPLEAGAERWLPASLPTSRPVTPLTHRFDFPNGETVLVQPITGPGDLPAPAKELHLAVVLDRSRSMAEYAGDAEVALARLAEAAQQGPAIDVYLTSSAYRGELPARIDLAGLDFKNIRYTGGQNPAELLAQFAALQNGRTYDAIFVLTDGTGYKLGQSEVEVPRPDAPLWMIHLNGNFPLGYDDATLEAIQASGGGVAGSVEEALTRLAAGLAAKENTSSSRTMPDFIDGYTWQLLPTEEANAAKLDDTPADDVAAGFAPFAARRLILATMQRQRTGLDQLDILDQLHAIAIEHSIVTPYSSMIVLVTPRQEQLLDRLEAQADRFMREFEQVGETDPVPITGVPEPEEWLLLALAAGMLIWYGYGRMKLRLIK